MAIFEKLLHNLQFKKASVLCLSLLAYMFQLSRLNGKSAMELNRLWLKFLLLCYVDIQPSSWKGNGKFKFLGIILESKMSCRVHFQTFREPKIQNFDHHGVICRIYWVFYKPPVLTYSEVGTYVSFLISSCLLINEWIIVTLTNLIYTKFVKIFTNWG